jgi:uncharacterized protein (DUF2141 family)
MTWSIFFLILCFSGLSAQCGRTADTAFSIAGTITQFRPGKTVYLGIFDSEDHFKSKTFCRKTFFKGACLDADTLRFTFDQLQPGEYVIAGYQDINGDGVMNMGPFGPTEPYHIYLPKYGIFGPKFKSCKFRLEKNLDSINIVFK